MQYDPLMTQFLTQGQMGHMPQAQFLTPQEYGAYRTLPGMQQMGAMPQHQMSMWQAYLIQNQGRMPFMGEGSPPYVFDVYNPAVSQPWYQTMAQRRWQDARASMGGAVADVGASIGVGMGVGAVAGGIPGVAAGLAASQVSAPYMDRVAGMRDIQSQTIPRIMGGQDVSGLGYGFSAPAAQRLDESIRRMGAGDMIFRQEDYRDILEHGVDRGLFDFDINEQQYTQTLRTLRDNVEVMQKLVGSTDFRELMQNMKRLMDMGMDPEMMGAATRMQAGFGFTAGRGIEEMTQAFGQPGAMAFTQAGLTPYQGSFQAMSAAASVEMSRRLGIVGPEEVARMGGVSGMTQRETQGHAQFMGSDRGLSDIMVAASMSGGQMNPDVVRRLASGEMSYQEAMNRANQTMGEDPANFLLHRDQMRHEFMDEAGPRGFENIIYHMSNQIGSEVLPGADQRTQMSAGLMQMGYDRETAAQLSQRMSSREFHELRREQLETELRHIEEEGIARELYEDSPIRSAMVSAREGLHRIGEETYGRFAGRRARRLEREERAQMGRVGSMYDYGGLMDREFERMLEDGGAVDEDIMGMYRDFRGSAGDPRELATARERQIMQGTASEAQLITEGRSGAAIEWELEQLQLADRAFRDGVTGDRFREVVGTRASDHTLTRRFQDAGLRRRDDLTRDRVQSILQEEFGVSAEEARQYTRDEEFMMSLHGLLGEGSDAYSASMIKDYRDRMGGAYQIGDLERHEEETRSMLRDLVGEGRADQMMAVLADPEHADALTILTSLGAAEETGGGALESESVRKRLVRALKDRGIDNAEEIVEQMRRTGSPRDRAAILEKLGLDPEIMDDFIEMGATLETDQGFIRTHLGGIAGRFGGDALTGTGLEAFMGETDEIMKRLTAQGYESIRQTTEEVMGKDISGLLGLSKGEISRRLEDASGKERTVLEALKSLHTEDELAIDERSLVAAVGARGIGEVARSPAALYGEEERAEEIRDEMDDIDAILSSIGDTNNKLATVTGNLDKTLQELNTTLQGM